jgi:hypothetical protein
MISLMISNLKSQNFSPASRAASARAFTRPLYLRPPRSKTTWLMPACFARSASRLPTVAAAEQLPPWAVDSPLSRVEAAASDRPDRSSMTWA